MTTRDDESLSKNAYLTGVISPHHGTVGKFLSLAEQFEQLATFPAHLSRLPSSASPAALAVGTILVQSLFKLRHKYLFHTPHNTVLSSATSALPPISISPGDHR